MTACQCPHPQRPDRVCNIDAGHTGDHVFQVTYGHGPVVVASWPGTNTNTNLQTGPTRTVQL